MSFIWDWNAHTNERTTLDTMFSLVFFILLYFIHLFHNVLWFLKEAKVPHLLGKIQQVMLYMNQYCVLAVEYWPNVV